MKSCLIKEIIGFLKPYEIRNITTNNKNKKFFRIILEIDIGKEYQFKSDPKNFSFKRCLINDAISDYHLPDLMKIFKYLEKDKWLLLYISKIDEDNTFYLKMFCLENFQLEKIIFSSKNHISCINHLHFKGEELILITNKLDVRVFNSKSDFSLKLLISKADNSWILTGCLFQKQGELFILSSINDNGPIKLWDNKGNFIKVIGKENLNQVIKVGVEIFMGSYLVVCISNSFITLYQLESCNIFINVRVTRGFSYIYHNNIKDPIIIFTNGSNAYFYSIIEEKTYKLTSKNRNYSGILEWNDKEYIIGTKGNIESFRYYHEGRGYRRQYGLFKSLSIGKFTHDICGECYINFDEGKKINLYTQY